MSVLAELRAANEADAAPFGDRRSAGASAGASVARTTHDAMCRWFERLYRLFPGSSSGRFASCRCWCQQPSGGRYCHAARRAPCQRLPRTFGLTSVACSDEQIGSSGSSRALSVDRPKQSTCECDGSLPVHEDVDVAVVLMAEGDGGTMGELADVPIGASVCCRIREGSRFVWRLVDVRHLSTLPVLGVQLKRGRRRRAAAGHSVSLRRITACRPARQLGNGPIVTPHFRGRNRTK